MNIKGFRGRKQEKKINLILEIIQKISIKSRLSGLGPEGREFESLCPDHTSIIISIRFFDIYYFKSNLRIIAL